MVPVERLQHRLLAIADERQPQRRGGLFRRGGEKVDDSPKVGERDVCEGRIAEHRVVVEPRLSRLREFETSESMLRETFAPSRIAVEEEIVHARLLRARRERRVAQEQRSLVSRREAHDAIGGGFVVEELLEAVVLLDALRGTSETDETDGQFGGSLGGTIVGGVGAYAAGDGRHPGMKTPLEATAGFSVPTRVGDARGAPRTITDAGARSVARPSPLERLGARLFFFRAATTTRPRARPPAPPTWRETLARFPRDASRRETISAEAARATGAGAAAVATRTPTTARIVAIGRSTILVARARPCDRSPPRGPAKRTILRARARGTLKRGGFW